MIQTGFIIYLRRRSSYFVCVSHLAFPLHCSRRPHRRWSSVGWLVATAVFRSVARLSVQRDSDFLVISVSREKNLFPFCFFFEIIFFGGRKAMAKMSRSEKILSMPSSPFYLTSLRSSFVLSVRGSDVSSFEGPIGKNIYI